MANLANMTTQVAHPSEGTKSVAQVAQPIQQPISGAAPPPQSAPNQGNYGAGNATIGGTNIYTGGGGPNSQDPTSPYNGMTSSQIVGATAPGQYGPGGQIALTNAQDAIGQEGNVAAGINSQIGYYQGMQAPTMQGAQLGAAPTTGYTNNNYNANGQTSTIGGAVNAGQVNINQGQTNQDRNMQLQNIGALQQQAAGKGPSVAAQQAQTSGQNAIAGQMATMASQRGAANSALGMRQAATGAAQTQQQVANQAVQGRMQEQLNAQQQLTGAIGGQSAQDAGMATNQAGLTQQTNLANAGAANAVNSQNASMTNQNNQFNAGLNQNTATQNANLQQQANLANQSMQGQYGLQQGQLDQQTEGANLQANLNQQSLNNQMVNNLYGQEEDAYGNMANQNLAEAGQISGQGMAGQQLSNQQNQFGTNTAMQIGSSIMSMAGGAMSDEDVKKGIEDLDSEDDALDHENTREIEGSNVAAYKSSGSSGGGSSSGMSSMMSSFGGGGGGGGADAMSDEREKDHIENEDQYQTQSFLDALKAHSWEYKNPDNGKGRFVGVMAQELEKTPIGKQAVIETPKGKMVDYARLASVMLAGQVLQNQQIKELKLEIRKLK